MIRLAYFEHPSYVPLLREAYQRWRDLEAASGQRVMAITGVIEAGYPGAPLVEGSRRSSIEHGLPHDFQSDKGRFARCGAALDHVAQFTDIARPGLPLQFGHRFGGETHLGQTILRTKLFKEMGRERVYIVHMLPQRWDGNDDHIEPVEEIIAKLLFLDHLL